MSPLDASFTLFALGALSLKVTLLSGDNSGEMIGIGAD
jgi:hypothetical protein